ncbi:hypothetical protein L0Y46_04665 [bacterium]|nr:hypothetical protein [bacterium]MCI0680414.1 hypothetical protein [bacterium]
MPPQYDLKKIKFATDSATFERAIGLYEEGKVSQFKKLSDGFTSVVLGGKPYFVIVSARHFDRGSCDCYLGEQDILCKHMVATAICAVMGGKKLQEEEKQGAGGLVSSGKRGTLNKTEISDIKKEVSGAMRYIKAYGGSSRTWFAYQDSLQEGCNRLSAIVSELPIGLPTAILLVDLLLRLDDRLCHGGVDDSDGTVGSFMEGVVSVLQEYAASDPECAQAFKKLKGIETCFGWEEPLLKLL